MSNLRTNLANRVVTEIFEYYKCLMRREEESWIIMKLWQHQLSRCECVKTKMERIECINKWKTQDATELKTRREKNW